MHYASMFYHLLARHGLSPVVWCQQSIWLVFPQDSGLQLWLLTHDGHLLVQLGFITEDFV